LVILFPFVLINNSTLHSQNLSDTLHLNQVEIKAGFSTHNQGFKKVKIDSLILSPLANTDLGTVLSQHSTIFIKEYGNGNLATPSFRGTSAVHTQVEWNGINITSPMLGQINFSIVPVVQFEELELYYGAATIARTSGAFGGVINLVSRPRWDNSLQTYFAQSFGSFQTYTTDIRVNAGTPHFQSGTRFNYTSSVNDFQYYNDDTHQTENQRNNSYYEGGLSQDLYFKIKNKDFITVRGWYSSNYSNIPPLTTNHDSVHTENQSDVIFRGLAEWQHTDRNYLLSVRSAYVDQYMHYVNDSIDSHHHSYSYLNKIRFIWSGIPKIVIKPSVELNWDKVNSDEYAGVKTRSTVGGCIDVQYKIAKYIESALVIREDIIDGKFQPLIVALGTEYQPFKKINLSFTGSLSRNYRFPTLNELYWNIFGNPDLRPETDYSVELGTVYNFKNLKKTFFLETSITGYFMKMLDLIVWLPVEGNSAIWNPVNYKEVLSRGIEFGLNLTYQVSGFQFKMMNNYNYCRSTNQTGLNEQDASVGKQLIYIPEHILNSTLTAEKSGFLASYNFTYTGIRYTQSDNTAYMPAYNLSNLIFQKSFYLKKIVLSLQVEINNLFDLDFQSIANRPMPGRYYTGTLKFRFTK
jgi:outer membrane cobalamin receptor